MIDSKGPRGNLWGDCDVLYFDCGAAYRTEFAKTHKTVHLKRVNFIECNYSSVNLTVKTNLTCL